MKSYEIKTTEDILNAVNEKNIDGFLKDFEAWLRTGIEIKKANNPFFELTQSGFIWNDDGEWGKLKSVSIEITEEKVKS